MKIRGNTVSTSGRRSDFSQSDPVKSDYILNKPDVEALRTLAQEGKTLAGKALPKAGGTMTGPIAMGGNKVTGLGDPEAAGDGASKGYVDGKHFLVTVALPAAGWAGSPYTQTVVAEGILETDTPHYGVVYSGTAEEKGLQKEGFALVDDLDTGAGSVTFTCFEEAPEVDLTIQLEVNR